MNGLQSEEDLALKQQLELYVERVQDVEPGVQKLALESMRCVSAAVVGCKDFRFFFVLFSLVPFSMRNFIRFLIDISFIDNSQHRITF
jgi:hypothetical protein